MAEGARRVKGVEPGFPLPAAAAAAAVEVTAPGEIYSSAPAAADSALEENNAQIIITQRGHTATHVTNKM